MAYRLACCCYEFVQLALYDSGLFGPDIGRIKVPVLGIDEGHAVLSFWIAEWVALIKETLSERRSRTLFVLDFVSQLQVREHYFA